MLAAKVLCLALGLVLAHTAVRSVRAGRLTLRTGVEVNRHLDRGAFWASIALVAALALACVILGLPGTL